MDNQRKQIVDTCTSLLSRIEKVRKIGSGGKRTGAGKKKNPNKMVNDTIKLPVEVKQGLTTKEKRNSLLLTFQKKINESKTNQLHNREA